jgi:SAM-dependent methyltransferase
MDYSDRLLNHGSFVTRLAHRSRLNTLFGLLNDRTYDRALDLGCADGWLLDQMARAGRVRAGLGVDADPTALEVARRRFEGRSGFDFVTPDQIAQGGTGDIDLLICTETLEHVNDAAGEIAKLAAWGKPDAKLVISVPIEVGPSLMVKQVGRYLANLTTGAYGYELYSWSELTSAALFWDVDSFESSHRHVSLAGGKGHKGFDFRRVQRELERSCRIDKSLFTPFPLLGSALNSTAFFVCTVNRSS